MTYQRKALGKSGEDIATRYLQQKGYRIIDRNLRLKVGEIDILAALGECIVLVEVKTKKNVNQGTPEEEVDYFKKKKLRLLARALEQIYLDKNIRIDVIAIDETGLKPKINHIINAVEAN